MFPVIKTQMKRRDTLKQITIPVYCICRNFQNQIEWLSAQDASSGFMWGVLVLNKVLVTVGIVLPACKLTFIFSTEKVSSLSMST